MGEKWFDRYTGQTTEELLASAGEFRVDSLVLAFEEAIETKSMAIPLTAQERNVLAVEALEREVNNGGYGQFLENSGEYADVIVDALDAIGCPATAALTRRAFSAVGLPAAPSQQQVDQALSELDDSAGEELDACDQAYYGTGELIADCLFAWIGANSATVRVGDA